MSVGAEHARPILRNRWISSQTLTRTAQHRSYKFAAMLLSRAREEAVPAGDFCSANSEITDIVENVLEHRDSLRHCLGQGYS